MRFILCIFVLLFFVSANAYSTEMKEMTCQELNEVEQKIDLQAFGLEQIKLFKKEYPEVNINKLERDVAEYVPTPGPSDNVPPFFYVIILACEGIETDESIQTRIQKTLYEFYRLKKVGN